MKLRQRRTHKYRPVVTFRLSGDAFALLAGLSSARAASYVSHALRTYLKTEYVK